MSTTLDRTLGAMEIGGVASTVLFGVVTVQAWLYIGSDFNDPLFLRLLVSDSVVFFCIAHPRLFWSRSRLYGQYGV